MHRSENLNWPSEWDKLLEGLKSISEAGELNRLQYGAAAWKMVNDIMLPLGRIFFVKLAQVVVQWIPQDSCYCHLSSSQGCALAVPSVPCCLFSPLGD